MIRYADPLAQREIDRLRAKVAALVDLFTYESLGEHGRLYARFVGDAEVTDEVAGVLASGGAA